MENKNGIETIKKINELLKKFNDSFETKAVISKDGHELVASRLIIKELKNDGSDFVNEMYEMFNVIIQSVSDEHELIFDQDKGLVVAKKVIKQVIQTDFVIEEFLE